MFFVIEIEKCHDAIRSATDPECASMDAINDWLSQKSVFIRVLNEKIDFSKWGSKHDNSIRENEIWLPAV